MSKFKLFLRSKRRAIVGQWMSDRISYAAALRDLVGTGMSLDRANYLLIAQTDID
jgi:hypothetical protein